jgi:hypothetical protein
MEPTEQTEESGAGRHWVIILLASAAIVGWGLLIHAAVKERPREWNFGSLPDTPGESIYSTVAPAETATPSARIFPALPEGRPWQIPEAPPTAAPAPAASSTSTDAAAPVKTPASTGVSAVSGTERSIVIPSERSESRNLAVAVAVLPGARRDSSLALGMTVVYGGTGVSVNSASTAATALPGGSS